MVSRNILMIRYRMTYIYVCCSAKQKRVNVKKFHKFVNDQHTEDFFISHYNTNLLLPRDVKQ